MIDNIEELLKNNYNIVGSWDSEMECNYYPLMDSIGKISKSSNPERYLNNAVNEGISITVFTRYDLNSTSGTEYVNLKNLLRIAQSIDTPNAEAIKIYLAECGYQRIQEMCDPELIIKNVIKTYRDYGLSEDEIIEKLNSF